MIFAALLATTLAAPPDVVPVETAETLIASAKDSLLNGESLDRDMDIKLRRLDPAARLRVLVFLRRSGMLEGPGWTPEMLLAPAEANGASK